MTVTETHRQGCGQTEMQVGKRALVGGKVVNQVDRSVSWSVGLSPQSNHAGKLRFRV